MLPLPQVIRLAGKLQSVWASRLQPAFDTPRTWRELETIMAEAHRVRNRVRFATQYNLTLTLPRMTDELTVLIDNLYRHVAQLREESTPTQYPMPSLAEWVKEIRQLEAEFGTVEVQWADQILRVVTEPIVLEDIPLGPFAIEFGWSSSRRFRGPRSFEVVALEPNSATGRDEIVHPHVEGRRLCAGNASAPLHQVLDAGCLTDAFLIVRSVLSTYNANSPYIPLSEWAGFACSDCGRRGDSHERYSCERCDSSLCDECASYCARCSDTRCADCLEPCDVCNERHCGGCLTQTRSDRMVCQDCQTKCPECDSILATDELHADTGLCADCSEAATEESAENSSPEPLPVETTHAS